MVLRRVFRKVISLDDITAEGWILHLALEQNSKRVLLCYSCGYKPALALFLITSQHLFNLL